MQSEKKYPCPACGGEMIWDSEEDAEDIGYVDDGTVVFYHCPKCEASIEMFLPYPGNGKGNAK